MYIEYWKRMFDYKGRSSVSHLMINMFINICVLVALILIGLFLLPTNLENIAVDLYYIVLILMIFPTVSMIVRVVRDLTS